VAREASPETVRVIREAGFKVAVTVDEAPLGDGWPSLLLPRCEAVERDVAVFAAWLERQFTR